MSASSPTTEGPREVGRYLLFDVIATGGMASIHLGRLRGAAGFSKTVAIKRLHPHLLNERTFVTSFIDEARIAARIQHPNVVAVIDVLESGSELLLVMEYVHGLSLGRLLRAGARSGKRTPVAILLTIIANALHGLHAAHEATDELGQPLHIVHRDVSPQNILVGVDGTARILDFGIAKARGRLTGTESGVLKGKLGYMAPEQLLGAELSRSSDIYAMNVVLWEGLTGRRLVEGETEALQALAALKGLITPPSQTVPELPPEIDEIILRAGARDPADRFPNAREMALALAAIPSIPLASAHEVGEWASSLVYDDLSQRASLVRRVEAESNREMSAAAHDEDVVFTDPIAKAVDVPPPSSVRDSSGGVTPTGATTPIQAMEPSKKRGLGVFAVAGGLLAVIVSLGVMYAIVPRDTPPVVTTPPPPPPAVSYEGPAQAPPPSETSSLASASATPTTSGSIAAATQSGPQRKGLPFKAPPPRVTTGTPPGAPAAKPNCDPPYVLNNDGTKTWKRECL